MQRSLRMSEYLQQLDTILPLATKWAEIQEERILTEGKPLSDHGLQDAIIMGVTNPERIRILEVKSIPVPDDPLLKMVAIATGLISPSTAGMALRYGIFIRNEYFMHRALIAHECVHTAQYERFGSIEAFLRQYLHECLEVGYNKSQLEREAITKSGKLPR
jgi:hypothetical protein